MNDKETAAHIRSWLNNKHGIWSWPTDSCGYDQHRRFVKYRSLYWISGDYPGTFKDFLLEYVEKLESGQIPLLREE